MLQLRPLLKVREARNSCPRFQAMHRSVPGGSEGALHMLGIRTC